MRHLSAILLTLLVLTLLSAPAPVAAAEGDEEQGVLQVVSMEALGELHRVRAYAGRRSTFLHLGDISDAVGGAWGRDPLSREPLFTLGQNRVLFSSTDRRIAVNGRRRKLDAPVEFRQGGIYVPEDFLEEVLEPLLGQPVRLLSTPPPPPAVAGETADSSPRDDVNRGQDAGSRQDDERSSDWLLDRERNGRALQRVVLDPGHGGDEEGAAGPSGMLEKNLVLDVSRRLLLALEMRGFDVSLTRTGDSNVPLDERTAIANNRGADLFLSLHANASPSSSARGAETYYLSMRDTADSDKAGLDGHESNTLMGSGQDDPLKLVLWDMAQATWLAESQLMAELIQAEFNTALEIPDRGVKQAPFRVLVGATMPAALVEIGFISNPEEEARLRDPAFLEQIVGALTRAIEAYRDRTARRPAFQPRP